MSKFSWLSEWVNNSHKQIFVTVQMGQQILYYSHKRAFFACDYCHPQVYILC